MADVPLAPIRIGFDYTVQIDFPAGFLDVTEGVRTKLRKFIGDDPVVPTVTRIGDSVTWELSPAQTAAMAPGTYYAEAEVYILADPATKGTMLIDNRYVIPCNHSPSE